MSARSSVLRVWVSVILAGLVHAHQVAFTHGMYAPFGTDPGKHDQNNNKPVHPLYMLSYDEYWMHKLDGTLNVPPEPGVYLEIPSGGQVTTEVATNIYFTTLVNTDISSDWGDGGSYPDDYHNPDCITHPNLHTYNETTAAGTAFAIAYKSDINDVRLEDLTIFTVAHHTPFKRVTTYDVPPHLPPCPEGGCICTWHWIPWHCGQPNMYMYPYKCNVTNFSDPREIGKPKPPVWCEGQPDQCTKGPKQPMIWNQLEGNNIDPPGYDSLGLPKSPGYNERCGFQNGAQLDIFEDSATNEPGLPSSSSSLTGSGAPTVLAYAPTSSLPPGSSTASDPASGTPTGTSTQPNSVSGTPTYPVSDPASGTPTSVPSGPASGLAQSVSGTPTSPVPDPASGTPTGGDTCNTSARSKRGMKIHRKGRNVF